jgi:hypothetical protein
VRVVCCAVYSDPTIDSLSRRGRMGKEKSKVAILI